MTPSPHLSFRALLDLAEGRPSKGRPAHVVHCERCRAELLDLQTIITAIREGDAGDAPELWQARAMLRQVRSRVSTPLGAMEADILRDSESYLQAGVRSAVTADRQWLLIAGPLEIEVTLASSGSDSPWPLSGQIFASDEAAGSLERATVTLMEDGLERECAELFATGEFLLKTWPRGAYQLRFDGHGWSVTTPRLGG